MGYLTTITLHNDALHVFEDHPEQFAKTLFEGITLANRNLQQVDMSFKGYANYITVEPSRHADATTVFLHWGNGFYNLGAYDHDFTELVKRDPKLAKRMLKIAKDQIKFAEDQIKRTEKTNKV